MRVLFVGPPGAGKGTQARILAEKRDIRTISSGDLLRTAVGRGTQVGREAKEYMDRGDLVPDELMIRVVEEAIRSEDTKDFVLDGFPRTEDQANALDDLLDDLGRPLEIVIQPQVPDSEIVERISGRRTCPKCQRTYHLKYEPPEVDEICDDDGTPLVTRPDDEAGTVQHRLDVYHRQTKGLIEHYEERGLLERLDGTGPLEEVAARVEKVIEART